MAPAAERLYLFGKGERGTITMALGIEEMFGGQWAAGKKPRLAQ